VTEVFDRDGGGKSGQRTVFHSSCHVFRVDIVSVILSLWRQ
jgi:hypothetical protein